MIFASHGSNKCYLVCTVLRFLDRVRMMAPMSGVGEGGVLAQGGWRGWGKGKGAGRGRGGAGVGGKEGVGMEEGVVEVVGGEVKVGQLAGTL